MREGSQKSKSKKSVGFCGTTPRISQSLLGSYNLIFPWSTQPMRVIFTLFMGELRERWGLARRRGISLSVVYMFTTLTADDISNVGGSLNNFGKRKANEFNVTR